MINCDINFLKPNKHFCGKVALVRMFQHINMRETRTKFGTRRVTVAMILMTMWLFIPLGYLFFENWGEFLNFDLEKQLSFQC